MIKRVLIVLVLSFQFAISLSPISDVSVLRVLFGDITDMSDLYLTPLDEVSSGEESPVEEKEDEFVDFKPYFKEIDDIIPEEQKNNTRYNQDVFEFNKITRMLVSKIELTPRNNSRRQLVDPEDPYDREGDKRARLRKLMLGFLIHSRFKCDVAIRQRKPLRATKSFRLGYLFNRLRRIKYNQAKIVYTALAQDEKIVDSYFNPKDNHVMHMARWYEKIVHLSVDLRDIIDQIDLVFEEVEFDDESVEEAKPQH